jgi:hypothetical protein
VDEYDKIKNMERFNFKPQENIKPVSDAEQTKYVDDFKELENQVLEAEKTLADWKAKGFEGIELKEVSDKRKFIEESKKKMEVLLKGNVQAHREYNDRWKKSA